MTNRKAASLRKQINHLAQELRELVAKNGTKAEVRALKMRIRSLEFQLTDG